MTVTQEIITIFNLKKKKFCAVSSAVHKISYNWVSYYTLFYNYLRFLAKFSYIYNLIYFRVSLPEMY
jgi:hypothetical protein